MTFLKLASLTEPADFEHWYNRSSQNIEDAADGMGFELNGYDELRQNALEALADNRTDVDEDVASTIGATLISDATFGEAMTAWMPGWYNLAMLPQARLVDESVAAVGEQYATQVDDFTYPEYSTPDDWTVGGRPAIEVCDTFEQRFILSVAILHTDWFVYIAENAGIELPEDLLQRTYEQSAGFFSASTSTLDDDVRLFQRLLFSDVDWVRGINEDYGLDSWLFERWAKSLSPAFEWLDDTTSAPAEF